MRWRMLQIILVMVGVGMLYGQGQSQAWDNRFCQLRKNPDGTCLVIAYAGATCDTSTRIPHATCACPNLITGGSMWVSGAPTVGSNLGAVGAKVTYMCTDAVGGVIERKCSIPLITTPAPPYPGVCEDPNPPPGAVVFTDPIIGICIADASSAQGPVKSVQAFCKVK